MRDVSTALAALLPTIRTRRQEIEQARRMPPDLAAALRKTGVFTLSVPRAIGGLEATPVDLMKTIETVAAADGSAGWCTMVGLGNNIAAGYMDERGAKEVFADPTAPSAGIAAPGRQGGSRRRRRAREWPLAVCQRHHALRLGVGGKPRHGQRPPAHDADGSGNRARLHADCARSRSTTRGM